MTLFRLATAAAAALLTLGACATKPAPTPPPQPRPIVRTPPPRPPLPVPAPAQDWRDLALSPGGWRYRSEASGSSAQFGSVGASFTVRCERGARRIMFARGEARATGGMTIRTSSGSRSFEASTASLAASDSFLDAMVFSRGRFTVETPGATALVVPAWPEPARVIEDCRG